MPSRGRESGSSIKPPLSSIPFQESLCHLWCFGELQFLAGFPPCLHSYKMFIQLKLVTVSDSLAEWELLPNVSPWVLGTIEYGYRIKFKYRLPHFSGVLPTTVKPERVPLLMLELVSPGQRGHWACFPSQWETQDFTEGNFWCQNTQYSSFELYSADAQVQDFNTKAYCISNPVQGLVCHNRLDAYFHIENLVCSNLYQVHGCSSGSFATPGHPCTKLHWRLAHSFPVTRDGGLASRCRPRSYQEFRFEVELQEKRAVSKSDNYVFQGGLGFDHDAVTTVPGSCGFHSHYGRQSKLRPGDFHPTMPGTAGSYGCSCQRNTVRLAAHEALSSPTKTHAYGKGHAPSALCPFLQRVSREEAEIKNTDASTRLFEKQKHRYYNPKTCTSYTQVMGAFKTLLHEAS